VPLSVVFDEVGRADGFARHWVHAEVGLELRREFGGLFADGPAVKALATGLFLWTRFAGDSSGSPGGGLDCDLRRGSGEPVDQQYDPEHECHDRADHERDACEHQKRSARTAPSLGLLDRFFDGIFGGVVHRSRLYRC
jgi:hypothetical protein